MRANRTTTLDDQRRGSRLSEIRVGDFSASLRTQGGTGPVTGGEARGRGGARSDGDGAVGQNLGSAGVGWGALRGLPAGRGEGRGRGSGNPRPRFASKKTRPSMSSGLPIPHWAPPAGRWVLLRGMGSIAKCLQLLPPLISAVPQPGSLPELLSPFPPGVSRGEPVAGMGWMGGGTGGSTGGVGGPQDEGGGGQCAPLRRAMWSAPGETEVPPWEPGRAAGGVSVGTRRAADSVRVGGGKKIPLPRKPSRTISLTSIEKNTKELRCDGLQRANDNKGGSKDDQGEIFRVRFPQRCGGRRRTGPVRVSWNVAIVDGNRYQPHHPNIIGKCFPISVIGCGPPGNSSSTTTPPPRETFGRRENVAGA